MSDINPNDYSATPSIYIGTPTGGYSTDTPYTAYIKYNAHSHRPVNATSFLYDNIKVGDAVSLLDPNNEDAFYRSTPESDVLVANVTDTSITVTSLARSTVRQGTLIVSRLEQEFQVKDIKVTEGSATIQRDYTGGGFVSPEQLTQALTKVSHVSYVLPPDDLSQSDPQSPKGSYLVEVNSPPTQLLVTGTGVIGEQALPDLYLVKGSTYKFTFGSNLRSSGGLYLITSDTFTEGENPPASEYTNGVTFDTINAQKIALDFNVPYSAPNLLYYMNPTASALKGKLYLLNKDYRNLPFYYSGLASIIQVPGMDPLPDYSFPVLTPSSYTRLLTFKLLPIWSIAYRAGYLRVNIVILKPDTTKTYLLDADVIVEQYGLSVINVEPDVGILEPGDVAQLNIYNPLNLYSVQCFTEYTLL